MSFGKSKARLIKDDEGKKITFADVAGLKEEKEELWEIVDFLKSPKRYIDLGARIPKGKAAIGAGLGDRQTQNRLQHLRRLGDLRQHRLQSGHQLSC